MVGLTRAQRAERDRQRAAPVELAEPEPAPAQLDDEGKLRLADIAARFLESEAAQEAFRRLDAAYVSRWRNGRTAEEREDAFHQLTALTDLKGQLLAMCEERIMARARLRQRNVA